MDISAPNETRQPPRPVSGGLRAQNSPSRPSPPPLAPLEYLQSQRRGSITDPSLHAGPSAQAPHNGEQPGAA